MSIAVSSPVENLKVARTANAVGEEVVRGDDTRLSNSRTPTAHKSTHATGGTDAIAPADIGAAAASHNHDAAYAPIGKGVTNGDSHDHSGGDGSQIAYSSLSGIPTLGNAASKNVGTTAGTVCAGDDARLGAGNSFETSTSNMKMNGVASVGSLATVPRADHVHPTDTSRLPEVWPLDAQNNYATIQRKTGTRVGIAMHGGGQTNGLYIEDGLANETGGVAIDNDGVTLFGAGDHGYIMRVVDEDRAAEGSTFEVRQDNRGTWVKNYVAPLGNIRISDNGYGCVEFYNSGIGYQYAAKFCTFKAGASEWYGITNDFDGGGSQLSLVAKAGGAGNIGFYIGSGTKAMTINSSGVATAIYGIYGAVGNDYADIYYCPIKRDQIQYRRVYVMSDGKPRLSMKYNEKGVIGIATNEQSFTAGKEELDGIPVSVGGFVSADTDRKYPAGTPLVCGRGGRLTKARWHTRIFSAHTILGFVLPDGRVRVV